MNARKLQNDAVSLDFQCRLHQHRQVWCAQKSLSTSFCCWPVTFFVFSMLLKKVQLPFLSCHMIPLQLTGLFILVPEGRHWPNAYANKKNVQIHTAKNGKKNWEVKNRKVKREEKRPRGQQINIPAGCMHAYVCTCAQACHNKKRCWTQTTITQATCNAIMRTTVVQIIMSSINWPTHPSITVILACTRKQGVRANACACQLLWTDRWYYETQISHIPSA